MVGTAYRVAALLEALAFSVKKVSHGGVRSACPKRGMHFSLPVSSCRRDADPAFRITVQEPLGFSVESLFSASKYST